MTRCNLASIVFLGLGSSLLLGAIPAVLADVQYQKGFTVDCGATQCGSPNWGFRCTFCTKPRAAIYGTNPVSSNGKDGYVNEDVGPCGMFMQGICARTGANMSGCINAVNVIGVEGYPTTCSDLAGVTSQSGNITPLPVQ